MRLLNQIEPRFHLTNDRAYLVEREAMLSLLFGSNNLVAFQSEY